MEFEMYCRECGHEWREYEENVYYYRCPSCDSNHIHVNRLITCNCGSDVYLNRFTNECDGCGALYNGFGQELASPEEWDDDDRYNCFGPQY